MNAAANHHDRDYPELVSLYALQVLPSDEVPAVEAHLAACADCRRELETLVGAFVAWPTDVLRPSTSLWDRLARRIAAETGQAPLQPAPEREGPPRPEWYEAAPGISCKLLATDAETRRVSMLVRLEAGADYPPHTHAGVEEVYMLDGVLLVDDKTLHPGDHLRSEPGTSDARVWSETGCTCVLITSTRDILR
jgi:anti-sigma factor ChrR (cupin superfamily)